ncbi:MAG: GNAT family N-acetyltransferase [Haloglomus sp.]
MARNLVAAANDNLETAFRRLAENTPDGATRQFGPLVVGSAGLPVPIYNRVFVFESPSRDDLAAAVAWLEERDLPYWVTVVESAVERFERLRDDLGLAKAVTQPGMVMPTLQRIPSNESSAAISEVTDLDELDDFVQVAASAFETPLEVAKTVYRAALAGDEIRLFFQRVDGQPAACGLLIQSEDVAGVYTIGVVEAFRRQGIGEAMTWKVLRAGRDAGCQMGVLQSSEMAYPLYQKMGFETVVTYHQFEPAA